MVITEFQTELVHLMEGLLKDMHFTDPDGGDVTGARVYAQYLPVSVENDEDEAKQFPYCIVRILEGKTADDNDYWHVTTDLLFGVYDGGDSRDGYQQVATMVQRTINRFAAKPGFGKAPFSGTMYRAEQDIAWQLQDTDSWPYFFGGVEISFALPKIERSDEFA